MSEPPFEADQRVWESVEIRRNSDVENTQTEAKNCGERAWIMVNSKLI